MIDTATIERYMRDANPIPHTDALDPDEFARFVAAAHSRRAAIMQAPTQHETTEPDRTTAQPSRSRRAWAFAAAFILILASIGIVALVLRGEAPVTDEPQAPPEIEQLNWTRVADDDAVFAPADYAWINSVISGGPGLVAVGAVSNSTIDEVGGPAVWTSPDGYEWSIALLDDPFVDESQRRLVEPFEMQSVTATESGLYAVGWGGYESLDPEGGWGVTSIVWTSPDGTDWTAIPLYQIPILFSDIVEGGPGLVATGEDEVWTSREGMVWTRAQGPIGRADIGEVIVGGSDLVAVGQSGSDAAVWTSQDATVWTRVPYDEAVFGGPGYQTMSSVTVGGPGLVAVGGDRGLAAVWTSPDGSRWTRIPHDEAAFGGLAPHPDSGPDFDPPMKDVVATDSALVAVGEQVVWTSRDGTTWSRIPYPESEMTMNSVAEGGPGLIAVGSYEGQAAVWVARP